MATRCRPLLGTFVEISVPDAYAEAIDQAFAAVAHIHARMSFHEAGSDLNRLHIVRPGKRVEVDRETVMVLREALCLYRKSGGLFDVAIGRELVAAGYLPARGIGQLSRFDGTSADIEIDGDHHVRLHRPVLIDLGGIAKGHAVDRAVEALVSAGVPVGLVNAGGDLRVFGDRRWPVSLRDGDGAVRQAIFVQDCAVASSANLRNRLCRGGRQWSPHIGYRKQPLLSGERVTVIAARCILADAMTKVAMADRALAERILGELGTVLPQMPVLAEAC